MSSTAPWWALVAAPIVSAIATLAWSSWDQRRRRRDDRTERWEREQMPLLFELNKAGSRLLDLPVWPAEATGAPAPYRPVLDTIKDSAEWYAFWAPAATAVLARDAAGKAAKLTAVIEDVRVTTLRGAHGTMDDAASERYQSASREFAGALDRLAVAVRRDLGITAPYAPRRPDGPR